MKIGGMIIIWGGNKPSTSGAILFGMEKASRIAVNLQEMFCC
jgi:hypothetical protein